MKIKEIRKLSAQDLSLKAVEMRQEIAETRRRVHMGETQNVRVLRAKRKELARLLTVLGEQLQEEAK